ncbi:MAG TPA: aminoacyl-tRNA hydrolase [Ktedonosporobacter sp.]|nr:aminoacyl-tRNA hydrolase [Ktedonosporobacter sp.]
MKLIVGLGNPGLQYEQTRHNIGFRTIDKLATKMGLKWERRGRAMLATGNIGLEKVALVKPITYMNNSGEAVGELARWYKVAPEDVLVVYDELDLPVGKLRLRASGSAGGHNGLDNIIHHLHTNKFPRLRLGIGRPTNQRVDTINYVLGVPPLDERIQLETAEDQAVEAIPLIIGQGIATTMNLVNADPEAKQKEEERRRQQKERREQERLRKAAEASAHEQAAQLALHPEAQPDQQESAGINPDY